MAQQFHATSGYVGAPGHELPDASGPSAVFTHTPQIVSSQDYAMTHAVK